MKDVHKFIGRVAWEPEHDQPGFNRAIDEIVADNVHVHIERMDKGFYWMAISKDGKRQIVTFEVKKGKIIARTGAE